MLAMSAVDGKQGLKHGPIAFGQMIVDDIDHGVLPQYVSHARKPVLVALL